VGCDFAFRAYNYIFNVSIHAPAWGATGHSLPSGCRLWVSIHAPAWGATLRVRRRARRGCVSIHAPAWGATRPFLVLLCTCPSFNPRTRVGCDSLIRGAPSPVVSFNPRTRVGCDDAGRFELPYLHGFQSTHPRGVRPCCKESPHRLPSSFNPRTRVGCDLGIPTGIEGMTVFQSTHPRGVRP